MTDQDSTTTAGSPGTALAGDDPLRALADRWATEALRTSNVPLTRPRVVAMLSEIAGSLAAAVSGEEFITHSATEAADRLIGAHFTGSEALGCSIRLLTTELLPTAGIADTSGNRGRLAELCGRLAEHYAEALRERLLTEQEMIKQAAQSAQRSAEHARQATEARFTAIFTASGVGIGIADLDGMVEETNPALQRMLGYQQHELRGTSMYELIHHEDRLRLRDQFAALTSGDAGQFTDDCQWVGKQEDPLWTHLTVSLVREGGKPAYQVAMLQNVSEERLLRGEVHRVNVQDDLTGLANSSRFHTQLQATLANAKEGDRLALYYLDLDGFKVINDGIGRQAGDKMLRHVAGILQEVFEPVGGLVARLAGDGFAVLLSTAPPPATVTSLADKALGEMNAPVYFDDRGVAVSASIGIVAHAATDVTADYLITAAEITTHRAKARGKAQWMNFEPGLDERDRTRFGLAAAMPGALENGEFEIWYQPVIRLQDRSRAGVRALLRWNHRELGTLTPRSFARMAAQTGLIVPLGKWMIDEVCRQAARWRERLGSCAPRVTVSLAPRLAADQYLVREVDQTLKKHELPADAISLVMPASALADPDSEATDSLRVLSELGVRTIVAGIGGDDAVLAHLRELPVQGISISSSAIAALQTELNSAAFERTIIERATLAHDIGLTVAAAALDTPELTERARGFGVDIGFGDALAPAGHPEDIELP